MSLNTGPTATRAVLYMRDYHKRTVASAPPGQSQAQYRDFFGVCYLDWLRDQRSNGTARQRRRTRLARIQAWRRADNKAYEAWADEVMRMIERHLQRFSTALASTANAAAASTDAWQQVVNAFESDLVGHEVSQG